MRVPSEASRVEVGRSNGAAHLSMAGRFDVTALSAFENALSETSNADVVLDLREVLAIDAAAWLAVVMHEQRARRRGRRIRLVNVPRNVRGIFELTGTDHVFDEAANP